MNKEQNDDVLDQMNKQTEKELSELAAQLRKPAGDGGLKMAEVMNESNLPMTTSAFEALTITEDTNILEIGPGNGGHLPDLLQRNERLTYIGIDISPLMIAESITRNKELVDSGVASFLLSDGETIPLPDAHVDSVMTVNTIYFWGSPEAYLTEIQRVMKPGAQLSIAFATKNFLQRLPFTKYGFTVFTDSDIQKMSTLSGLILEDIEHFEDIVVSKSGDRVTRQFAVALLQKS